ncbi:MAG: hypothetical protein H6699_10685 [Myxococcales bacterium]|nr:hypothetical protein [Myxococcales bacterium]
MRARAWLTLVRWLGPWAAADRAPTGAEHREVAPEPGRRARLFSPRHASGRPLVVVPGVHYLGADDARIERLGRVIAAAGRPVVIPYIEDFARLRVTDDATAAVAASVRWAATTLGAPRVDLFSISFGCLPASRVAAFDAPELVDTLTIFGGYADWQTAARFALTGHDGAAQHAHSDPLNLPVLVLNLADAIPALAALDVDARRVLDEAWIEYCRRTWGRDEMKVGAGRFAVAHELAATLPVELRGAFVVGAGAEPGAETWCTEALRSGDWGVVDPGPALGALRCRVRVFHGAADDVMPVNQLAAILAAVPPEADARGYVTGLYAHTGTRALPPPAALARELRTMAAMLAELAG